MAGNQNPGPDYDNLECYDALEIMEYNDISKSNLLKYELLLINTYLLL